jgi:predicted nucleotidyltransferase
MNARLELDADALARFCIQHRILRLALFGSTLTGAALPGSDIDLLVEFQTGQEPGLLALAEMEAELSAMLHGRSVDLRTPQDLSRYFRDEVLRTAEVQYAGG